MCFYHYFYSIWIYGIVKQNKTKQNKDSKFNILSSHMIFNFFLNRQVRFNVFYKNCNCVGFPLPNPLQTTSKPDHSDKSDILNKEKWKWNPKMVVLCKDNFTTIFSFNFILENPSFNLCYVPNQGSQELGSSLDYYDVVF